MSAPVLYKFRTKCPYVQKDLLHWFPGHMNKGMKQMQQKLKSMDCLVEVHDARIPFTGRNPIFTRTLAGVKPHILVLNKKDLIPPALIPRVRDQLRAEENMEHVLYTNCKDHNCRGVKGLSPLMVDVIKGSDRFNRSEQADYNVMIIGVPNVGKSSLINRLRSNNLRGAHVLPVGAIAGITRSVLMKMRISKRPEIFMLDTPGILEPSVTNIEMGLKLAACASLQDHLVGEEAIADYILYYLNKHEKFSYVQYMGLDEPSDDINRVLIAGALKFNKIRRTRGSLDGVLKDVPDLALAARTMIKAFRTGELGKMFLDYEKLKRRKQDNQNVNDLEFDLGSCDTSGESAEPNLRSS